MKTLLAFIRKEFYHVFRDKRTLLILFGLPIAQIMLFGFALSNEVKNIGITVMDNSKDNASRHIINSISNSEYFIMQDYTSNYSQVKDHFMDGSAKCALIFPKNFDADLQKLGTANVQVITDGSDPNTAKTVQMYLTQILGKYTQELNQTANPISYRIIPEYKQMYNEEQNGSLNFVPGVISLIFMIVSVALTSVSVVKEKETGTMEILLVSPFKPIMVLVAKALPYLLLSFVNLIIILALSYFVLDVPIRGSVALIFLVSLLFIIACLSLGLLISNITASQQTAMLISMMGMMLPTLILTGFMFPLENMPKFFQWVSHILPSQYYYNIIKSVMLKGLGFSYVWKEMVVLCGMTVVLLTLALSKFKKRLA